MVVFQFNSKLRSIGSDRPELAILKIHNRHNLSSHLELDILEKNGFFACYLSKLQTKNLPFSKITSLDD